MSLTSSESVITAVETSVDGNLKSLEQPARESGRWWNWRLIYHLLVIGFSTGLVGYDAALISPLISLPQFVHRYQGGPGGNDVAFTARNLSLLVAVPLSGTMVSAVVGPLLVRRYGHKKALIVAYFALCTPGSFLQLFANSLAAFIGGRIWAFSGLGMITIAAPLYLIDVVPAAYRGRAIGCCAASFPSFGIIATTVVWRTVKLDNQLQYQIPLATQAALPCIIGFLTFFLIESPTWLTLHNRFDEATTNLRKLRSTNATTTTSYELTSLHDLLPPPSTAPSSLRPHTNPLLILSPTNLPRTVTASFYESAQQLTGIALMQTYATIILVQSHVTSPYLVTVLICCLQLLGTIVGPILVDRFGRRPLILYDVSALMILNLVAGGIAATGLKTETQGRALAGTFVAFNFFYAIFASVAYLIQTELAPPHLREATIAYSAFWAVVTGVIVTYTVPQLTSPGAGNLGAKTAFVFAGCCIIILGVTGWFLPETKGRTLGEIEGWYVERRKGERRGMGIKKNSDSGATGLGVGIIKEEGSGDGIEADKGADEPAVEKESEGTEGRKRWTDWRKRLGMRRRISARDVR